MDRRKRLGAVLLVVIVATSGCLNLVTGGTTTFEASQATVSDSTLDQTGYELGSTRTDNVTREISAAGQERTVTVSNQIAQYHRNISLGPLGERELARFIVLSTPAVEVAGQTFNPVGDWSERRIVRELSAQYSGVQDVSHVNNRSVRVLGEQRTVGKFSGQATVADGRQIDVLIHVTKFRHGDDFVVGVGVHPKQLPDEQSRTDEMFRGVDH